MAPTVKFRTKSGQVFTVTEARLYRKREIALAHRKFFSNIPPYQLVSVNFYGQPVPSITTPSGGVVRLLTIIHKGEEVRGPRYMSSVLRVYQMRVPKTTETGSVKYPIHSSCGYLAAGGFFIPNTSWQTSNLGVGFK